jgi:hypothetical protein
MKPSSLLFLLFLLSWAGQASASDQHLDWQILFREANQLFAESADYEGAKVRYEQLLAERGPSPAVMANLALCHLKMGEPGWARVYLERALLIKPNQPDWRQHLKVLLRQQSIEEPTLHRRFSWLHSLSSNQWFMLALLLVSVPGVTALTGKALQGSTFRMRSMNMVALTLTCLLLGGGSGFCAYLNAAPSRYGIVVSPDAALRQSPFEQATVVQSIQEAQRLRILGTHEQFLRCQLPGTATTGWIHRSLCEPIAAPPE